MVGYVLISPEAAIGRMVLGVGVHPRYRGQGIGTELIGRALEHSKELGGEVAHAPASYGNMATRRLLTDMGFKPVRRYWEMRLSARIKAPHPQPPEDYHLYSFQPGDEAELTRIQNLSFGASWGFCPNTLEEIRYRVNMSDSRPEGIIFIARGDRVVGYCWTRRLARDDKAVGQISMMGVDPSEQSRGLGRMVLLEGLTYLRGSGLAVVELTVDGQNQPAIRLYQSVGFRRSAVTLWYEKRLR